MERIACPAAMQRTARAWRLEGRRVGLVPTMGALHGGHLSLVRRAREQAEAVVVSLFVNPAQFAPGEDYERYPRDPERDEALCRREGVDALFCPEPGAMYAADASVAVVESRLSRGLCGASRPTHFQGVCTVVAKLFHLCDPDLAVFGCKDYQQLRVIEQMTRDLDFPVRIVRAPIVREPDGLAMSSRNALLAPGHRRQAAALHRALEGARARAAAGERRVAPLVEEAARRLAEAPDARVDYLRGVDAETLEPVETLERPVLLALAVFFGRVRLLDNTLLPEAGAASRPPGNRS